MKHNYTIISIVFLIFCTVSSQGFINKGKKKTDVETSKKETASQSMASLMKSGKKYIQDKKYAKGIKEYEKALTLAMDAGDEVNSEECYKLLMEAHQLAGNDRKVAEYRELHLALKTKRENAALQRKQRMNQIEISRLKEQQLRSELGLKEAQDEIVLRDEVLTYTRDSLKVLDLMNKETQAKVDLLEKEKELKEIKVREQKALLQNKELQISEQESRLRAELYIILLLTGGFASVSLLGFFFYRNINQRKKATLKIEEQFVTIHRQHENITNSINYAQRIQQAMLPQEKTFVHFLPESFILYKPKDVVSGDFYWFYNVFNDSRLNEINLAETEAGSELPDASLSNKIIIAAGDCTGHGVPGALMSMIGYNLLNEIAHKKIYEPHTMLNELHNGVRLSLQQHKTENKDGMDIALCVIDKKAKTLEFSGAKNPMIFIQDNELYYVKGDKDPIGGSQGESKRNYSRQMISLDRPTWVYMFTDGYVDQFGGPEGRKFMIKNLKELLLEIHQKPFSQQKIILDETIEKWRGGDEKQIDDMLIMGMKVS